MVPVYVDGGFFTKDHVLEGRWSDAAVEPEESGKSVMHIWKVRSLCMCKRES